MLRFLRIIVTDPWIRLALLIAGGLHIVIWLLLLFFIPHVPFLLLSYNIHIGINDTGAWWYVLFLPLLGLSLGIVNTLIAAYFFLKERLVSYYCMGAVVLVQCILLLAAFALVMLNR